MEIAPATRMGLVELSVSDLDRSLAYWQDAIGLRVLSRENGTAELGAGSVLGKAEDARPEGRGADTPLVRFVEEPGARSAHGFTGLFHVALLVPDRPSLGRFLAHTAREQLPLTGLSDHAVSEAIYLRDPHGKVGEEQLNGGEFAELEERDWAVIRPSLEENERLFGIPVSRLLEVDGRVLVANQVYRKIRPKATGVLQAEEAWVKMHS